MAVEVYGVVQIGGPITTVKEAEQFVALAREFGASDDTVLVNGFLSVEFVGTPQSVGQLDPSQPPSANIPLVPYVPEGQ